jgi:glutamyl-Q tRNA(Asp) synthetase
LGSLVTAVASFVHARQARGEWLVRIEDIDPPREVPGAAEEILRTLEALDLEWDRTVLYQSSRLEAYDAAARGLLASGRAYRCRCSRSEILATNEGESTRYPGTCRDRRIAADDTAVRVRVEPGLLSFTDALQGRIETDLAASLGDYVIVRRDALPAYHLAVVLDDAEQGITTIVRGVDLLDSTAAHVHLQRVLELPTPAYYHVPIVVDASQQKLSKQTGAAPVNARDGSLAARVVKLLGLSVPQELQRERPALLWQWAIERWTIASLKGQRTVAARSDDRGRRSTPDD